MTPGQHRPATRRRGGGGDDDDAGRRDRVARGVAGSIEQAIDGAAGIASRDDLLAADDVAGAALPGQGRDLVEVATRGDLNRRRRRLVVGAAIQRQDDDEFKGELSFRPGQCRFLPQQSPLPALAQSLVGKCPGFERKTAPDGVRGGFQFNVAQDA